ncbi:peptidylprolyl isomerase [Puia dinghuensis]|uniref:Peptidyl-prolyl cis-trans isomerase n=1 Tax=Puia dinghuensis TaxID=1792502 RepID=A0A8J2XUI4_9BACT|nr:peptidylprolyl isomerase [Puia dinghuensis]GGB12004.1 peptidyl-prolyl cis-trans isomerase [Puia dinghuensis]
MSIPVKTRFLIPTLLLLFVSGISAQTLFTVDHSTVSREEFLKAYSKNNTGQKATPTTYRDYLELYIRYKLKVRAAYDAQLDTLAGQRTELQNFRSQVAESYLKDETSLDRLVKEAFQRGQKDIRLSHILIQLPKNATPADTVTAYEKAMSVYAALKKGKKFGDAALQYSDDPSVKSNAGNLGYITVFTLPYTLESVAYSLAPGKFSLPCRTKGGYHIFRNDGERKSLGRIKIAQILVAYPPSATGAMQMATQHKADSIYALLQQGGDFAALARANSADNLSYQQGGELPEFGVGRYDSAFEAAAFSLDRDGAISKPIPSAFGYHILKRIARKPFPTQWDEPTAAVLKQQVLNDPRIEVSRKALLSRIEQQADFRPANISESDLWAFTDSSMRNMGFSSFRGLDYNTTLFSFSHQSYTLKEWLDYARASRGPRSGGADADKELYDRFVERMALGYYRDHLEDYNKDFAFQLTEFREGNLLFEIMQRKIWDKASTDSAGLRKYYDAHKDKYWWEASADALLFTCNNTRTAEDLKTRLQAHPIAGWRQMSDSGALAIQADSGRYELTQIPNPNKTDLTAGLYTPFSTNTADNSISFAYILNIYHERSPRNFRDARGFVINDYQTYLEDEWIAELKKKYAVKVDDAEFKKLP